MNALGAAARNTANTIGLIAAGLGIAAMFSIPIAAIAAWFTHIIVCIQDENWLFLIAGAIMAPIAVIHGVGCWFGAW